MYPVTRRRQRMMEVMAFVAEKRRVRLNDLLGEFTWRWGLRPQTLTSYLDALELAGMIRAHETPEGVVVEITEKGLKTSGLKKPEG